MFGTSNDIKRVDERGAFIKAEYDARKAMPEYGKKCEAKGEECPSHWGSSWEDFYQRCASAAAEYAAIIGAPP